MKRNKIVLIFFAASIGLTAFKIADDIITRLGMQQQAAQGAIINNIVGRFGSGPMDGATEDGPANSISGQLRSFRIPYARLLPDIMKGDKAAAAKELCDYIKQYMNSQDFMTEYNKTKEAAMPLTDNGMSLTSLKRNSEVFRLNIKNYPNDIKYIAEQQKQLEDNEKRITALLNASKKPFPNKDIWEKTYPANPSLLIKKRLEEYLQIAATVDFAAKLTGSGKKQTFVNPVYEKKSLKWKAIFRAGKEVNDVVVPFVKEWLKEGVKTATVN